MYQILVRVVSRYAPIITLPVAVVIGIIGYNIESFIRKDEPVKPTESVLEARDERLLRREIGATQGVETMEQIQKTSVLDRNSSSNLKYAHLYNPSK